MPSSLACGVTASHGVRSMGPRRREDDVGFLFRRTEKLLTFNIFPLSF